MNEAKRLIKNTGIIAIGNSCTKLLQFFLLPLYTAVLTTADYGTVDFVTVLVTFCVPVSTLLMDESLFRFLIDCKTDIDRKRVVTTSLAVVCAGCVGFSVVAGMVIALTEYVYGLWFILYTLSNTALMVAGSLLRGFGRTVEFSVMNFIAGVGTVLLNILFLVAFDLGVIGMLSASIIAQSVAAIVFLVKIRVDHSVAIALFDKGLALEMARYSVPLIPTKVSWTVMNMSSRLIIMPVLGAGASGLYALAYKFPNVTDMVFGFFFQSWKESSARVLAEGEDAAAAFYLDVNEQLKRVMGSIIVLMVSIMHPVFALMVDQSYADAVWLVPVLLLATYFSNMSGFVGGIFTARRETGIMGISTIASAAVNLAFNIFLIPVLGLWGAALSTLLAIFVVYAYRLIKVQALAPIGYASSAEFCCLIAFAISCTLFYTDSAVTTVLSCVFAVLFVFCINHKLVLRIVNSLSLPTRTARIAKEEIEKE